MSAIYQQVPLRLQLGLGTAAPFNANTGTQPKVFRGQSVAVQVGAFASNNVAVDFTNLAQLTLVLQESEDSLVPLVTKTVLEADITKSITIAAWLDGSAQQATFGWLNADTDQSLDGATSKDLWIVITGLTKVTGSNPVAQTIIYAAGPITFAVPGLSLPFPPFGYVSRAVQTLSEGNITVEPPSLNHTEEITVDGDARDSLVILSIVGMTNGALLRLRFALTDTPAINLAIVNATAGGTSLMTFSTGSVLNGFIELVYNEDDATWKPLLAVFPATF